MDSGKIIIGVLAGMAVGATLGVLFAPDKGSVTRKKLSTKGLDLSEDLKEKLNGFVEILTDRYEKVKSDISEYMEHGNGKPENIEKEARITQV